MPYIFRVKIRISRARRLSRQREKSDSARVRNDGRKRRRKAARLVPRDEELNSFIRGLRIRPNPKGESCLLDPTVLAFFLIFDFFALQTLSPHLRFCVFGLHTLNPTP